MPALDDSAVNSLPGLGEPFPVTPALAALQGGLLSAGARPVLVGGCVRDHLLGAQSKDVDVEVYGLGLAEVEAACAAVGDVYAVGRSFGVLKVRVRVDEGGEVFDETFDVALPRRESKVGTGHRGFVVESDPQMPFAEAAARRDFTLNALGYDLEQGALIDEHDGVAHLQAGVLRHVSEAFDEDPLRVLRAAQIAARFGLTLHDDTVDRCRRLQPELATLPKERLWEELKKLLLKAPWPSIGLSALVSTGAISIFPELEALRGCPQEAEWHPEGDVWVHTLMVTDEAARLAREEGLDDDERLLVVLGALCHDLGKPPTTVYERERIRSPGHEAAGEPPTRAFLERVGAPHAVIDDVVALVREHLKPFQLYKDRDKVGDGALRRLALRVPLERLVYVARADHFGRTTPEALAHDDPAGPWLLEQAERLAVKDAAPNPILLGRHVIPLGVQPGPKLGELLKEAFDAQLEGAFSDLEGGLDWVKKRLGLFGSGLLLIGMALVAACDPSTALSRVGLFAFQRDAQIQGCCNCLAEAETFVDNALQVCPEIEVERVDPGDAGCPDDGGCLAAELRHETPCLCGDDAETCRQRLNAGLEITVVGECVGSRGECAPFCNGVLAYPVLDEDA